MGAPLAAPPVARGQAQIASPSLLCTGNVVLGNQGGGALSQPILSAPTSGRSQFGGVHVLDSFSSLSSLSAGTSPGLTGIHQGINGEANCLSVGASSLITGSNSGASNLSRSMGPASDSFGLSGMGSKALPASPRSISSSNLSSMARQQGGSPLSRLDQQDSQLNQQVRMGIPPTQLLQQQQSLQSLQQEQSACGIAQQLTSSGQQPPSVQSLGSGGQVLHIGGTQQGVGFGLGVSTQVAGHGASQQQALASVKLESHSRDQALQPQQVLMTQLEIKAEDGLCGQMGFHSAQGHSNLSLPPELQLDEVLRMQRQQTHLNLLQQQQLQQRQQQQEVSLSQSAGVIKESGFEAGVCARRLMQYLYHQRHRPPDNNITFWRKFVAEYFAPRAKKRWCVSLYGSGGRQPTGIFPQDVWHCEICGTKPGRGFGRRWSLPGKGVVDGFTFGFRLGKIKYDSGILEELLFVDLPNEYRLRSGHLVLEYGKAIQESVFEQLRVVRDGQLRIVFSSDLKILSWEFCARSHEELLPQRLIVPQVTQLAQILQKYQTSATNNGGIGLQEMQTNCHLFVTSARQLAKSLEAPTVNDLGYTKRYVRCLQISEVVNSMKDLIDFSRENNVGPIASLHSFPRRNSMSSSGVLHIPEINQALQQQQQQDQLDLHNLVTNGNASTLTVLDHLGSNLIGSADGGNQMAPVANSFFQQNSLASLRNSLQSTPQNPLQNVHQSSTPNTIVGALLMQQQLPPAVGSRSFSGSLLAPPTTSVTSFRNSLVTMTGGGGTSRASLGHNPLLNIFQKNTHGIGGGASLLQQQQVSAQASQQPAYTQNVVNQLLQGMMMSQQLINGGSIEQCQGATGLSRNFAIDSGLGGLNPHNGAGGMGSLGIGSESRGVSSDHLGVSGSSLGGLVGGLSNSVSGGGVHALSGLGNHSRSIGGGTFYGLRGNMGAMNDGLSRRLNLAALAQHQNVHLQDWARHELTGNGMLGSLGADSSFGGLPFNWQSS